MSLNGTAPEPGGPPEWLRRVRPVLERAWEAAGEPAWQPKQSAAASLRASGDVAGLSPGARAATDWFRTFEPPAEPHRRSAVLMLFSPARSPGPADTAPGAIGCELLLTERAHTLRSHAAQIVCPGGHLDRDDDGSIGAALREAREEVGLDPASVTIVDELPALYLHPTGTAVHPVLGWWPRPHPVHVVDEREVAQVLRADVDSLLDPDLRFTTVARGGYRGPGFEVDGLVLWGFTANLFSAVAELGGIARHWDEARTRPLPDYLASAYWPAGA